jgi:hypothetical protein
LTTTRLQNEQMQEATLRMVAVTVKNGLSAKSPLAFAHFGGVLSSIGYVDEGCRLGELNTNGIYVCSCISLDFSRVHIFATLP